MTNNISVLQDSPRNWLILAKGSFREGVFLGTAAGGIAHCGLERGASTVLLCLPFLLFPLM